MISPGWSQCLEIPSVCLIKNKLESLLLILCDDGVFCASKTLLVE